MTENDKRLVREAEDTRIAYYYIEGLFPYAETEECKKRLKEEYDRAWRACEIATGDTI